MSGKPNPDNDLPLHTICECGHPYSSHYNGRGDCTEKDGCQKFKCAHAQKTFKYTKEDWFDGDEEDVYTCDDCGDYVYNYIPR